MRGTRGNGFGYGSYGGGGEGYCDMNGDGYGGGHSRVPADPGNGFGDGDVGYDEEAGNGFGFGDEAVLVLGMWREGLASAVINTLCRMQT